MLSQLRLAVWFFVFFVLTGNSLAQQGHDLAADDLFQSANALMDQKKPCEALAEYRKLVAIRPSEGALYNGGLAAFLCGDYKTSAELWRKLELQSPDDWQVKAKLVQAYQASGDRKARDTERESLFDMRKNGASQELKKLDFYCREQVTIAGRKVFAFEYFEMKGDRAVRYSFDVLDANGKEDFRISLGSYDLTNAIWAEHNKELAEKGQRLFHLDGYYKWGHATFGMYSPEPSYDEVRDEVIKILSDNAKPMSTSVVGSQKEEKK